MAPGPDPAPLLPGSGLVLVDDFCRASGLDRATVESLVASGRPEGAFDQQGRLVGFFNNDLPTAGQLRSWGLTIDSGYDAEMLRGQVQADDDSGGQDPEGSSWTMVWGHRDS